MMMMIMAPQNSPKKTNKQTINSQIGHILINGKKTFLNDDDDDDDYGLQV